MDLLIHDVGFPQWYSMVQVMRDWTRPPVCHVWCSAGLNSVSRSDKRRMPAGPIAGARGLHCYHKRLQVLEGVDQV